MCFKTKPIWISKYEYFRHNKGFAGSSRFWKQGRCWPCSAKNCYWPDLFLDASFRNASLWESVRQSIGQFVCLSVCYTSLEIEVFSTFQPRRCYVSNETLCSRLWGCFICRSVLLSVLPCIWQVYRQSQNTQEHSQEASLPGRVFW